MVSPALRRRRSICFIESYLSYLSNTTVTTSIPRSSCSSRIFFRTCCYRSSNVLKYDSFSDCNIAIPSMTQPVLSGWFKTFGRVGTSAHSSFFAKSDLFVFSIVPSSLKIAGGTAASSCSSTFGRSISLVFETDSRRRNNTSVLHISFFCLSVGSGFRMSANVLIVSLGCGSQKLTDLVFYTKRFSEKLFMCALPVSCSPVRDSSISCVATCPVTMLIREVGTVSKSNGFWY